MERKIKPKVSYDSSVDVGYINLKPHKKVTRTVEVGSLILVDYDGNIPVGIEVLAVSKTMPELPGLVKKRRK